MHMTSEGFISEDHCPAAVRSALAALLSSSEFRGTDKRVAFLAYVVQEKLECRASNIKGYTIGVDVYGRSEDYDPQSDPIVRLEAGRLRRDLEHYYLTAGKHDEIVFDHLKNESNHIMHRLSPLGS